VLLRLENVGAGKNIDCIYVVYRDKKHTTIEVSMGFLSNLFGGGAEKQLEILSGKGDRFIFDDKRR
jgi:hypothetical protein